MGKVFLIGGSARVGKSTLADRLRSKVNGSSISGDALAQAIRTIAQDEWLPDLFVHKGLSAVEFEQLPIDERIDRLRARDRVIWTAASSYIDTLLRDCDDDVLYEGGLWPDFLAGAPFAYRVVFLVDTSPDRAAFLKYIRDTSSESSNDWMREHHYTDERIEAWARFDIQRARRIIELCKEHNMPYFDIGQHGIGEAQALAERVLLRAAD